jgi:hypothetical protein
MNGATRKIHIQASRMGAMSKKETRIGVRFSVIILLGLSCLCPLSLDAQAKKQLPAEEIGKIQQLEKVLDDLKKLEALTEEMSKEKYYKCLKAFGSDLFCGCIRDNLPVIVTFEDYIAIITSSKEELNYNKLGDNEKKTIDLTHKTREICINKKAKKRD